MHALTSRDGADREREDRRPATPERGREPDRRHVQVLGQQLRRHDDGAWEQRTQEEALKGDCDDGDDEGRDEPEQEAECHC